MSERGHMRGYRRGGFPGVYTGGQWETAHATFYGGSDASGVVVVTIFDGDSASCGGLLWIWTEMVVFKRKRWS